MNYWSASVGIPCVHVCVWVCLTLLCSHTHTHSLMCDELLDFPLSGVPLSLGTEPTHTTECWQQHTDVCVTAFTPSPDCSRPPTPPSSPPTRLPVFHCVFSHVIHVLQPDLKTVTTDRQPELQSFTIFLCLQWGLITPTGGSRSVKHYPTLPKLTLCAAVNNQLQHLCLWELAGIQITTCKMLLNLQDMSLPGFSLTVCGLGQILVDENKERWSSGRQKGIHTTHLTAGPLLM